MIGFSVIIPCYNASKYIEKCLDSIFANDYENYEVLIVNDGSTDSTMDVVQEYFHFFGEKTSKLEYNGKIIKVIDMENSGVSSARNHGIAYAEKDYVLFVDSDDTVKGQYFQRLNDYLRKNPVDILIFGFEKNIIKQDGTTNLSIKLPKRHYDLNNNKQILEEYFPNIFGFSASHIEHWSENKCINPYKEWGSVWRCCYKRSLIEENKLRFNEEISLNEDSVFNMWCCVFADTLHSIEDILYVYTIRNSGSMISKIKNVELKNKIKLLEQRCKIIDFLSIQNKINNGYELMYGTNILSLLELMLNGKDASYDELLEYANNPAVMESIECIPNSKIMPFDVATFLLKHHGVKFLYICCRILQRINLTSVIRQWRYLT